MFLYFWGVGDQFVLFWSPKGSIEQHLIKIIVADKLRILSYGLMAAIHKFWAIETILTYNKVIPHTKFEQMFELRVSANNSTLIFILSRICESVNKTETEIRIVSCESIICISSYLCWRLFCYIVELSVQSYSLKHNFNLKVVLKLVKIFLIFFILNLLVPFIKTIFVRRFIKICWLVSEKVEPLTDERGCLKYNLCF